MNLFSTEKPKKIIVDPNFQTPIPVCQYMVDMIPPNAKNILEPTAGLENIVSLLKNYNVTAPEDFFLMKQKRFDCVVMNPPFSSKSAFTDNIPAGVDIKGMKIGYHILFECMNMSDNVIALVPWFTISDSDVRLRFIKKFGLKSITALPRKTFQYARIQTCVLELEKGYSGESLFKTLHI
jgi:type I restriction-modification system DNA methylase subunit